MSRKWCKIFFHTPSKNAYKEGIYKLPERWRRCIESQEQKLYIPKIENIATAVREMHGDI
ncbi:hypothetical protein LAZ67_8002179 [Cordylochernes scorpioides]|uniref:Uncharacterized protein n=1 Tax=Cordylochernes scorpioides TaxID=51811 RepID=A0ABY6KTJ3_9ARAC|nr:hypothetical protein LAZ67_8002179 [Cordylochernes scorpioides]